MSYQPTPQGLIEALDDFAMHVGGDRYFTQELDGAGQGREFITRGHAAESFVNFVAHRERDPSSDEITDTTYVLEDGTIAIWDVLPQQLAEQIDYDPNPEDTINVRDYTSYTFSISDKIVEVLRTQAFRVDDQFNCEVPVIGKHVVYDTDLLDRFEPVVTRDEATGFAVVEYALPGEAENPELDEFDLLVGALQRDTSKIDSVIGTMLLVLATLRS